MIIAVNIEEYIQIIENRVDNYSTVALEAKEAWVASMGTNEEQRKATTYFMLDAHVDVYKKVYKELREVQSGKHLDAK